MDQTRAYVFDTLGEPHGACILPGEDVVEYYFRDLNQALETLTSSSHYKVAIAGNDADYPKVPANTPDNVKCLIDEMKHMVAIIPDRSDAEAAKQLWCDQASQVMNKAIRRSVELRALVMVLPKWWPEGHSS